MRLLSRLPSIPSTLLLAACLALSSSACGGTSASATTGKVEKQGTLNRAQMKRDAEYWYDVVQEVHPAPYSRISKEQMEAEMRTMLRSMPEEADPMEFLIGLSSLASWMRDSHTGFSYPDDSAAYDEPLFRYRLQIEEKELLWISSDSDGAIPVRASIKQINGVEAGTLLEWLRAIGVGELDAAIERDGASSAPAVFWAHGIRAPFTIEWSDGSEEVITSEVPGRKVGTPPSKSNAPDPLTAAYTEDNVAVLKLTSMPDPDEFFPHVEKIFNEVAQREPQAVVIDIRNNSGGTTEAADMIFSLITDKHYRIIGGKHWRVSARYKKVIREQYGARVPEYENAPNGKLLISEGAEYTPEDYGFRYDGPVAFLIGPGTASAAMMMANAAQDYELAILIGQPTSSPPNYFGELYTFTLPESGITAGTSVAYFIRANGDETNLDPVKPHIPVRTTAEDLIVGRDPVMEAALDWATH